MPSSSSPGVDPEAVGEPQDRRQPWVAAVALEPPDLAVLDLRRGREHGLGHPSAAALAAEVCRRTSGETVAARFSRRRCGTGRLSSLAGPPARP